MPMRRVNRNSFRDLSAFFYFLFDEFNHNIYYLQSEWERTTRGKQRVRKERSGSSAKLQEIIFQIAFEDQIIVNIFDGIRQGVPKTRVLGPTRSPMPRSRADN